jgi:glycosidase
VVTGRRPAWWRDAAVVHLREFRVHPRESRVSPRRVPRFTPRELRGRAQCEAQPRARAALLAVLGLPGAAYLYQGQELGPPEVDVPEAARQDPMWARGGGSRDG